ncbi:MAG: restriction endonuclease subunit S [Bacteroidales bacterium]|nr:restriction endonuclease subunit S [Bacteroidales bacterium]
MNTDITYQRLGDYIREVNLRNRDLKVTRLLGVGLEKKFFPSIANIIGTDLSNYKIIRKGQFGCKFMSVGRDGILPVSLLDDDEPAIISSAYYAFEVNDPNELLPEYLMMWLRRPEFDRELWFYSGGDVRGGVNYEAFCDMPIIVPTLARQREIVAEYETLDNRIRLNEQMIAKLEETAQALYRKMFVDGVDKENLPEGWRWGKIGDLFELQRGFDLPSQDRIDGDFPIYASTGIAEYHNAYKVEPPCVVTGRSGTIGEVFYVDKRCWPLNTTLWVKDFKNTPSFFVYYKLKELELGKTVSGFAAVPTLNRNDVHMMESSIPPTDLLVEFEGEMKVIHQRLSISKQENEKLTELQSLLLARMGK